MRENSIVENKFLIAIGALVISAVFVLMEYFNDGVVTHHLLADENLPGISNWLGLVTIPFLALSVSILIKRRRRRTTESISDQDDNDRSVLKKFLAALLFGIVISLLWELNLESVLQYFILLPILLAFFRPVHLPEYLLGFAIGMIYSFGGILPIIIGFILLILCFLIHKLIQFLRSVSVSKMKN